MTRPWGPLTKAQRQQVRGELRAAAQKCGVTVPSQGGRRDQLRAPPGDPRSVESREHAAGERSSRRVLYSRPAGTRSSRSSRAMATAPAAGPTASSSTAARHPTRSTTQGTALIVTTVSRNPMAVCVVRAVPT